MYDKRSYYGHISEVEMGIYKHYFGKYKLEFFAVITFVFLEVQYQFALIVAAGGVLSIWGTVTIGAVVSFLTYSKQFGRPLNNIAGMLSNVQSALVGAERVFEILDD